jgi:predicted RNase H-like HicB family nuclease
MRYPIAIETGDAKHAYGVAVPDLPGCFSAGDTMDDSLTNAREAILLHLEGLLDDGQPVPKPSTIEPLRSKRSYRGWTWAIVDVDVSELGRWTRCENRRER